MANKKGTLHISGGTNRRSKLLDHLDVNMNEQLTSTAWKDNSHSNKDDSEDTDTINGDSNKDLDNNQMVVVATENADEDDEGDVRTLTPPPTTKKRKRTDKGAYMHL
ncbi:hypothetical protein BU15DRAFT_69521, partial [Melanogaster broomeanus]